MKIDYDWIKTESKRRKCKVEDLIALSRDNDPFYVGTPGHQEAAQWFASLWNDFGYTTGIHLRRFHYRLVHHTDSPTKHNGEPYLNTEKDWAYLGAAGKKARYLGLVDVDAFVDRRNPEPHIHAIYDTDDIQSYRSATATTPEWDLPKIEPATLELPYATVGGYDYSLNDQPYHLEVWCEKSTMNDQLIPVCREHSVNLITGLGEMSITAVDSLLDRIAQAHKPTRIFYISDFDLKGYEMPVSVSRKVEYMVRAMNGDGPRDIKIKPLVLTRDQIEHYDLPRVPYEVSDKAGASARKALETRKAQFYARHGDGVVELDALEGIYPGELARIVIEAIEPYRDQTIETRLISDYYNARRAADQALRDQVGPHLEELSDLGEEINKYIQDHAWTFNSKMQEYQQRVDDLRDTIEDAVEYLDVTLPDRSKPESAGDTCNDWDWIYDSRRDYEDQLEAYKAVQVKRGDQ